MLLLPWSDTSTDQESAGAGFGLGKMFSDPTLWAKLAGNPKTAPLLADPAFAQKVLSLTFLARRAEI